MEITATSHYSDSGSYEWPSLLERERVARDAADREVMVLSAKVRRLEISLVSVEAVLASRSKRLEEASQELVKLRHFRDEVERLEK